MKPSNIIVVFILFLFAIPSIAQKQQNPSSNPPSQPPVQMRPSFEEAHQLSRLFDRIKLESTSLELEKSKRNQALVLTPELIRIILKEPLRLNQLLLAEVEALQKMVAECQNGKLIDPKVLEVKTRNIRKWAKQIRTNDGILFFDYYRKSPKIANLEDELGLAAISKLRELSLEMSSQLATLLDAQSISTVSVLFWYENSFASLCKGIEKLSKQMMYIKPNPPKEL